MRYRIHRAHGNLTVRQQEANRAGCIAYAEQHLNAIANKNVSFAMVIVAANASEQTKDWGRTYTRLVSECFGHKDRGLSIGPKRGSYNVKLCRMPAILLEPGCISNEEFAARARTGEGLDALAKCLVDSIVACFPDGGLIGLSVGHGDRGKPDPGAPVNEPGEPDSMLDPDFDDETELNVEIIRSTMEMLESINEDG